MQRLPVLIISILSLVFSGLSLQVWATTQTDSDSSAVTATVPSTALPDIPTLISPANNSTINTTAPTFIFNPSLGVTIVNHYQLWLDGSKNTDHIPASNLTITTNAVAALNEGSHNWFIKAIGPNSLNRDSATWTFTIDTTAPSLALDSVAGQDYTNQPNITTGERQPLFVGRSDTGTRVVISLSGTNLSLNLDATVGTDGKFSLKPTISLSPDSYTVSVSSTDESGNTTNLPSFILTISEFISGFTIPLPSPFPDLSFNLPFLNGTLIPEGLTAFPIAALTPVIPYLLWLVLVLLFIHLVQLRRHLKKESHQSISLYIYLIAAIIILSFWIVLS